MCDLFCLVLAGASDIEVIDCFMSLPNLKTIDMRCSGLSQDDIAYLLDIVETHLPQCTKACILLSSNPGCRLTENYARILNACAPGTVTDLTLNDEGDRDEEDLQNATEDQLLAISHALARHAMYLKEIEITCSMPKRAWQAFLHPEGLGTVYPHVESFELCMANVDGGIMTDVVCPSISGMAALGDLRFLHLQDLSVQDTLEMAQTIENRTLAMCRLLSAVGTCQALTEFNFDGVLCTLQEWGTLGQSMHGLTQLKSLSVGHNNDSERVSTAEAVDSETDTQDSKTHMHSFAEGLGVLSSLTYLCVMLPAPSLCGCVSIASCGVSDVMQAVQGLTRLTSLCVECTDSDTAGHPETACLTLWHSAYMLPPTLTDIQISNMSIPVESLPILLRAVRQTPHLHTLDLRQCNLTADHCDAFPLLNGHPTLQEICLRGNPLKEGASVLIDVIQTLPRFNDLVVSKTRIPRPLYKKLRAKIQELQSK
ncbi:hypothetical protein KIPB_006739 [Kipferlia bialata]|uniref:Uncharacterized protein n=1 Tax=Kipferlia bialata TaxID=797122 RepID=A0A9K3D0P2_9EUKA|nr:hypothetical protein KIPB_006739 [Kipferlia bialata]|eukprot:g6739.t1